MGHVNRFQILKVETADLLVTSESRSYILRFCCCQGREKYRQTDRHRHTDIHAYKQTERDRDKDRGTETESESHRKRKGGGGERK